MNERSSSSSKRKGRPITAEIAFGMVIREHRLAKGLTQADLESESGIDRSYISQLENGQKQACLKPIIQIAMKLGITPGQLVEETVARMDHEELQKFL